MLSFRKKIFFIDLIAFFSLFLFLLPLFGLKILFVIGLVVGAYICINQIALFFLTKPIKKIVDAIHFYKTGEEKSFPIIDVESMHDKELNQLAFTFNSLNLKVKRQFEEVEHQKKETEGILESLCEGVIATDTSAKIIFVNRTACQMLKIPAEKLIQTSLKSHGLELFSKCHELILDALQTSERQTETYTLRDHTPIYFELIATPLTHQSGALLVLQDKTSDYKIVELGKDFIANASHELRTPITIIRGFAETLNDLPEVSKEMLGEITEKILKTCLRLDKLVRSLLTLSDVENLSQDRLKSSNLIQVVENCKYHLLTLSPKIDIQIKTDLQKASILADGDLLELAISNLLENAIKYSSEDSQIQMNIEKIGEVIQLQVIDSGIGIPKKDLSFIFDRFYTVDKARSRKSGGAGLGLSIVKTIIEKHRGKIFVSSEIGKGSVFTITLPQQTSCIT